MESRFSHEPIMTARCVEYLRPVPGETFLDGTLGGGGHAEAVLEKLVPGGRLVGIDLDDDALGACRERLSRFAEAFVPAKGNFKDAAGILRSLGIEQISGAMLDLGVSSWQLDEAARGFSYSADGPLDMRMDKTQKRTAWDVVNKMGQDELARIIRDYGEDHFARRIASFIVNRRERSPIMTTAELSETIVEAIPAKFRRQGPHPAKRTFQAIRIEVNGELEGLEQAVETVAGLLKDGGRLCVLSFHSLEDRAVKQAMKRMENPCTCPKGAPYCICGRKPMGKMVTRKPETPDETEQERNPRSRSAKLRVFERLLGTPERGVENHVVRI
jgi:16S rRNA (cytosine1402-N4)-methyltransferase